MDDTEKEMAKMTKSIKVNEFLTYHEVGVASLKWPQMDQ